MDDVEVALDRHGLVMSIWLAAGLVAVTLFKFGFADGGVVYVAAAFGVIMAAFGSHIIVNAVYRTFFTPKEVGLGILIYAVSLVAFGFTLLVSPAFRESQFTAMSLGFIVIFAAAILYMITHFGLRGAFASFDVIRQFKQQSR
jgi:hypothetical protein